MGLREIESRLPPGFRFYPTDEELVCHYLYNKVTDKRIAQGTLVEVNLHEREPWELPEVAKLTASEWYFFSFRDLKYATRSRTNCATKIGYWKATGKDREVRSPATCSVVGTRKTLLFYRGRAPNGVKTGWAMHEFRLDTSHLPRKEGWVLCRVFQKRKGDGDQDNAGSSHLMPNQPVTDDQIGSSSAAFTPPQDVAGGSNNPFLDTAMLQYDTVLDQYLSQEVDEYGFFFDMGFGDMANLGGIRFPQMWN